jgi:hypothetical protein
MDEPPLFETELVPDPKLPWWLRALTPTAWLVWPMFIALALGAVLPLIGILKNALD